VLSPDTCVCGEPNVPHAALGIAIPMLRFLRERFENGTDNFGGWKLIPDVRTQRI
jgi:hypothetical protein